MNKKPTINFLPIAEYGTHAPAFTESLKRALKTKPIKAIHPNGIVLSAFREKKGYYWYEGRMVDEETQAMYLALKLYSYNPENISKMNKILKLREIIAKHHTKIEALYNEMDLLD